ncbi:hypothetical protein Pint_21545 [Pistacia integerrima]|uniref:Uncharacterized protein n=1 Tax=Pistacia integerrima TaxID=434235 RepID=A0ACC0XC40_9ROSI|nr:hypothetical protein Pint_21545 [Pistacia integerrima]
MQKSLPSTQQKRIVFSVPSSGMSGGQDKSGKGKNGSNEKPINAPVTVAAPNQGTPSRTGNNPSRGGVTTIQDSSAVAAPNQGTPSGTGNNPCPAGVTTIHDSSAVAAPNRRTPRTVDNRNPQNLTFVPTHKQVNK